MEGRAASEPDIRVTPESLRFEWAAATNSVAASPDYFSFMQPGGSRFVARKQGDELYHWLETREGYSVRWNGARNRYEYLGLDGQGGFRFTGLQPGLDDPALAGIARGIRETRSVIHLRRAEGRQARMEKSVPAFTPNAAAAGSLKVLVILACFSDTTVTYSAGNFHGLFNTPGYNLHGAKGSVRDYYAEVSYNHLSLQAEVSDWVRLPQAKSYYGGNDYGGDDLRPREMIRDAILALDVQGFDFSPYDADGDGWVDAFCVIHEGPGEEAGGGADSIWSHQWVLSSAVRVDGVKIQSYYTGPEVYGSAISTIGVHCHELGHSLGLPDLYDTDDGSEGLGRWCLMASGTWNDSGRRPGHLSAWAKAKLGWLTPTLLSATKDNIPLLSLHSHPKAYKIAQGMASGEYLLLENRAKGGFDNYLPGYGFLAYHVDENIPDNDDEDRYKVALLQADGKKDLEMNRNRGDGGDPFPGAYGKRILGPDTNPSTDGYSNPNTQVYLSGISDPATTMTFWLSLTGAPGGKRFCICNDGGQSLSITTMSLEQPAPWITWSPAAPFTVAPGTSQPVTVVVEYGLAPTGSSSRRLRIYSNDPDENPYPSGVSLLVVTPASGPVLTVSPTTRLVNSRTGTTLFTVSNTGIGTMAWTAEVVSGTDWLSIPSGASGTNTGSITVERKANLQPERREGIICVTAPGAVYSPVNIVITQTERVMSAGAWEEYGAPPGE